MGGAPRGAGVEGGNGDPLGRGGGGVGGSVERENYHHVIHCLEGRSERGKSEGGGEAEKAAKKSAVYLAIRKSP